MKNALCFRGIDNKSYYFLNRKDHRYYMDYSGCGGCLNMSHPRVLQFIMDSLRYWVLDMHVDGFRFDLAATLARGFYEADRLTTFFDVICQDPVLSQVKLIAEPWDLGPGGYQVGNFPELWTEWNGKYRDIVRKFWKSDEGLLAQLGYRLTGSSDLYKHSNRNPHASINFITCHDGFTLRDLVSYGGKHNEANGEDNRDGTNENESWNCGAEGPTDNSEIKALRVRQMKNFLATLFFSQGTPMLFGGDEFGKTKQGNNNTYCQDNELSWIDWNIDEEGMELLEFTRKVIDIRKKHPVFRRKTFFQGRKLSGRGIKDIHWYKPDGKEMRIKEWDHSFAKSLGMLLTGDAIPDVNAEGEKIIDDTFLILLNAHWETVLFVLPKSSHGKWCLVVNTFDGMGSSSNIEAVPFQFPLGARSMVVLRAKRKDEI